MFVGRHPKVDRHVAGHKAGPVSDASFLRVLAELVAGVLPFKLKRRR
jgi:hypothetical protein